MELHTFSSLTKEFLLEYANTMDSADLAIVFFKEETIAHKKLDPISKEEVKEAFRRDDLEVFTSSDKLQERLLEIDYSNANLLMMSSGNFGGIDVNAFAQKVLG